jgi:hypothetical protein
MVDVGDRDSVPGPAFVAALRFVAFHFIRCIALQAGWGGLQS